MRWLYGARWLCGSHEFKNHSDLGLSGSRPVLVLSASDLGLVSGDLGLVLQYIIKSVCDLGLVSGDFNLVSSDLGLVL